ncbi:hypothetical protein WOLCODRAFT_140783 [Wolfiporia cocos MD-104 SS10]|uniref:Uncharacterized protein n=1 Tax=Wolfiporia cocos (strain MD-104) TaxID=742152 RepID=A0A2H3J4X1_WOLCO|nr:hypothetical protein WOLCODRAFT_140783 [Wolfiporia cocos MD-104 SS10]
MRSQGLRLDPQLDTITSEIQAWCNRPESERARRNYRFARTCLQEDPDDLGLAIRALKFTSEKARDEFWKVPRYWWGAGERVLCDDAALVALVLSNDIVKLILESWVEAPRTSWTSEDSSEATRKAWTIDYVGDGAARLIKTVERISLNDSIAMPYSNTMPIIQSSGTGKSRMVDEMAISIFTLPFKLAPMGGNGATYPDCDETIRDHLTSGIANTRHELTAKYLVFFASLFSVVAKEVKEIWGNSPRVSPSEWRKHLEIPGKRASLYSLAVQGVSAILGKVVEETWKRTQREIASSEQRTTRESPPHSGTPATDSPPSTRPPKSREVIAGETFCDCASEAVKQPIQELQEAIHPASIIVLYFDESHILFKFKTSDSNSYYHGLLSALDVLRLSKIIGLFLSTTSYLAKYAPTYDMMPSERAQAAALQPPYTELPFDCHPDFFPVPQNKFTVDKLSTPEFQANFGRPLFWSRYRYGSDSIRAGIVEFARGKLLCSPSLASASSSDSQSSPSSRDLQELAVLDMRIMLDFGPHRDANIVQQHLIERHMRIAVCVPSHREYFYSAYTSEPLLAEAAARVMAAIRKEQKDDDDAIAWMLQKYTKSGLISKGDRGEMVARLLLTLAFDKAQMSSQAEAAINYSNAVLVKDFLVALLGEEQWGRIKTMRPDNTLGKSLEDAFKYAKVRFTHFGRASDDSASTSAAAFLAMLRGIAFQCCPQQPVIDIVIPVFLDNESSTAKVCEERMTALLIQVKNRVESSIIAHVAIDEAAVHFFPEGSAQTEQRPYIAIVMDLGIQPVQTQKYAKKSQHPPMENEGEGREATHTRPSLDLPPPLSLVTPSTPSKVIIGKEKSRESPRVTPPHLRYSLYIYGCSRAVYGVIGSQDIYANLLESRNMFNEHSRPENLAVLKGMKVLWARGPECYGFGQNCPAVQEVRGQEVEGVNVGG